MRALSAAALLALVVAGCAEPVPETEDTGPTPSPEPVKVQGERLWRGDVRGATGMPFEVGIDVPRGTLALRVHQGPFTGAATHMAVESPCATWRGSTQQVALAGGGQIWRCKHPPSGPGIVRVSADGAWQTSITVVAEVAGAA